MNRMLFNLFRNLRRDRRAATAMVVALMIVPLILMCGAAVDFSRVSSARTQLQAAVDAAAVAGDGTYQADPKTTASQAALNALHVAQSTFKAEAVNLAAYSTIGAPAVTTACTGTPTQCGAAPSGSCTPSTAIYCVTVTANATLKNSLLGGWIPSDALSATATASSSTNSGTNGNCPTTSRCVQTSGTVSLSPGGNGGNLIFSSNHLAGTGAPESNPTSNNPGGGAEKFNIFLNGNNNALPGSTSYVAPTQNTGADPCPANPPAQTLSPGSSIYDVNNTRVSCDFTGNCTLPGGTYCGTLTIGAGVNLTLTSTMSNPAIYVEDGNLLVSPNSTIACTAASGYSSTASANNCATSNTPSKYVPIYFGGTNSGSIIVEQTSTIDPSQITSGNIQYISAFNSVNVQLNGTTTYLQAGVCQDAASYCTSGAIGGPTTITYSNAGTITYNDTYITNITITNGLETHWAQTEVLATEFQDGSGNIINTCNVNNTPNSPCIITQTVSYGGDQSVDSNSVVHDTNLASTSTQSSTYSPSSVTPSSTLTCSTGQQLYYDTTTGTGSGANPNLGYSYAGPTINGDGLLAETINICGFGTALASNGGSGTGTTVGPSGTSTSPILVY
jgi:Flp pilus assembly protein TadG